MALKLPLDSKGLTLFTRSHHSLTLNSSQTATYTAIVTIEGAQETALKLSTGTSLNDLLARFQGHDIIQRQITRKWYKTEL